MRDDGKWYWDNGELASDGKWRTTPTSSHDCAVVKDGFIQSENCNTRQIGGCSTKAAGFQYFITISDSS